MNPKKMKFMKKISRINSLADLQAEKQRLKQLSQAQEAYLTEQYQLLAQKVEAPIQFVKSLSSWIPGGDMVKSLFQPSNGNAQDDWLSKGLRIGSTFVLNRFFLKKAGFVKRLLVTLISQQALGKVNKNSVQSIVQSLTNLVRPAQKKRAVMTQTDDRIPEYSETS
jgi:hypothetical protein